MRDFRTLLPTFLPSLSCPQDPNNPDINQRLLEGQLTPETAILLHPTVRQPLRTSRRARPRPGVSNLFELFMRMSAALAPFSCPLLPKQQLASAALQEQRDERLKEHKVASRSDLGGPFYDPLSTLSLLSFVTQGTDWYCFGCPPWTSPSARRVIP